MTVRLSEIDVFVANKLAIVSRQLRVTYLKPLIESDFKPMFSPDVHTYWAWPFTRPVYLLSCYVYLPRRGLR